MYGQVQPSSSRAQQVVHTGYEERTLDEEILLCVADVCILYRRGRALPVHNQSWGSTRSGAGTGRRFSVFQRCQAAY